MRSSEPVRVTPNRSAAVLPDQETDDPWPDQAVEPGVLAEALRRARSGWLPQYRTAVEALAVAHADGRIPPEKIGFFNLHRSDRRVLRSTGLTGETDPAAADIVRLAGLPWGSEPGAVTGNEIDLAVRALLALTTGDLSGLWDLPGTDLAGLGVDAAQIVRLLERLTLGQAARAVAADPADPARAVA